MRRMSQLRLDISVGFAGLNRNLSYHQVAYPPANQPSPYSLPFWPVGVRPKVSCWL